MSRTLAINLPLLLPMAVAIGLGILALCDKYVTGARGHD